MTSEVAKIWFYMWSLNFKLRVLCGCCKLRCRYLKPYAIKYVKLYIFLLFIKQKFSYIIICKKQSGFYLKAHFHCLRSLGKITKLYIIIYYQNKYVLTRSFPPQFY